VQADDIAFCQKDITSAHPNFRFHHFDLDNSHGNKSGAQDATSVRFPADDKSIDFVFATGIYTHFMSSDVAHYLRETARVRFGFPFIAEGGTCFRHEKSPPDAVGPPIETIQRLHAPKPGSGSSRSARVRGPASGTRAAATTRM
jgi:hypothetical protein